MKQFAIIFAFFLSLFAVMFFTTTGPVEQPSFIPVDSSIIGTGGSGGESNITTEIIPVETILTETTSVIPKLISIEFNIIDTADTCEEFCTKACSAQEN